MLILFVAGIQPLFGKQISTSINPASILIGEHAVITFSAEVSQEAEVLFPLFNDTITGNIEILNYGDIETISGERPGMVRIEQKLTVTSWQEGFHPIVPFNFKVIENNDTLMVESQPTLLEVQGVPLDQTAQLKDIKGIMRIPVALAEILPWVLLTIVVLIIAFLLYRYFKSREKQSGKHPVLVKPEIPAHIAALNSLENLKARKLWQQGLVKDYYVELTDILRLYLEKRFEIDAIEMTTAEIIPAISSRTEGNESCSSLKYILQLADLVKFAKHIPDSDQNDRCMELSFEFVLNTIAVESTVEEK